MIVHTMRTMVSVHVVVCGHVCVHALCVMVRVTLRVLICTGEKARSFFVKSKLPNHELSHIW